MAIINTRQALADYALRNLGAPVIEINIADEQIDDRIDEALQKYWEFHSDGSEKSFVIHQVLAQDKLNKWITIPENVLAVVRVFPHGNVISGNNLQYTAYMTDVLDQLNATPTGGLGNYMVNMSYLETINWVFNYEKPLRFNRHTNKLYIDMDWNMVQLNSFLAIECTVIVDPEQYDLVWNDMWFKKYVTALFKRQWGTNLLKYDGFQLPSGMTLNGRQIFDDAKEEITVLEEELINTYQFPIDWFVG